MTSSLRLRDLNDRLRWLILRTPLRLSVFLLLATAACLPMLRQAGGMNTFHDAQFLSAYERHARITALDYGQLPLWDPFSCGGMYGLAAPQTRYATPLLLLSMGLGVDPAAALLAVLLTALGMEGMFRYARSWGASAWSAFLCAPLFPLCGWFATVWRVGWVQFFSFCGLPFILLGLRAALRGAAWGAYLCAIASALTLGLGGTWTLPMGALLMVFEVGAALVPGARRGGAKERGRIALHGLIAAAALSVGVSAYRLWPMLESIGATLRVMGGEPQASAAVSLKALLLPSPGPHADYDSYYLTPLIPLALVSLGARRWWVQWAAAALMFALSLGHVAPFAPFALLRELPLYHTIRYPERCLVLFAIVAALLTAGGVDGLLARLRARAGSDAAAIARLVLVGLFAAGWGSQIRNAQRIAVDVTLEPTPAPRGAEFRQSRGNRWLMSHFAAEGMGSLGCGEAYPLPMSMHLRGDLAHEEYLVARDAERPEDAATFKHGLAERVRWSPNALEVQVETTRTARLAINQNYHPGWRSNVGEVQSWDGLLSVMLPPGAQLVKLHFAPRSGLAGAAASLLALLAGGLWLWRPPRARAARALCVGAGPLLIALSAALWREPGWEHPAPRTPDGQPVVVDSLPRDARRLHIQFDAPIALEGTRMPELLLTGTRTLDIDLFFRRQGELSASLGIFVHLLQPGRKPIYADHAAISGQLYLPRMPLGRLTRDAFRVALPDNATGAWEVRVGLWNAFSDHERRAIIDAGGVDSAKRAALIGRFELH